MPGCSGRAAADADGLRHRTDRLPGYDLWIADYSSVGGSRWRLPAVTTSRRQALCRTQCSVQFPWDSDIWAAFDPLNAVFPGITAIEWGRWVRLPERHVDGVAACSRCRGPRRPESSELEPGSGEGSRGADGRASRLSCRTGSRWAPTTSVRSATAATAPRRSSATASSTRSQRPGEKLRAGSGAMPEPATLSKRFPTDQSEGPNWFRNRWISTSRPRSERVDSAELPPTIRDKGRLGDESR